MNARMDHLNDAIQDSSLRALVALTEQEFTGHSTTGGASATVDGALNVVRVDPGQGSRAGEVGIALTEALNDALGRADDALKAHVNSDPSLAPQLRGVMDGDALPSDGTVRGAELTRDFEGRSADGQVVAHVSGTTRRVSSVYLASLNEELVQEVPTAVNRALAAAQAGREGITPLDEEIDLALEQLDKKMGAIEEQLDGVDERLDKILRDLG